MNILYINCVKSKEGLATLDVYTPIKELVKRGSTVVLISMNDGTPYYESRSKNGGILKVYPMIPPIVPRIAAPLLFVILLYMTSFPLMLKINKIIKKNRPQLLLSSSDYPLPMISFLLSKINKLPLAMVYRETNLEVIYLVSNHNITVRFMAAILMKINCTIYKKVQHSIAISKGIELFLRDFQNLKNITTINLLCFNLEELTKVPRVNNLRKLPFNSGDTNILYAGSLAPIRRLDILIDAFSQIAKRYDKLRLVIAGNGSPFNVYLKKIRQKDLRKRIEFLGLLPRETILAMMPLVDVCVDPYPCEDWTPGCKILEYMACGKCVIATDNFRNRLYVRNGINGLLFNPNDVGDLIEKLNMVLRDAELRKELGQNARRTIERKFDVRKVVSTFEEFCLKALSDSHGKAAE